MQNKKSDQAEAYWQAAKYLVHYINKIPYFGKGFLDTPKANVYRHFTKSAEGRKAANFLVELYKDSLVKGGHNDGRWAKYLFNRYDKNRWDTLYNVASNYAKSIA